MVVAVVVVLLLFQGALRRAPTMYLARPFGKSQDDLGTVSK